MKNLELVTTENFGTVTCDFYRNVGNEIFMTREQIGEALEYSNPAKAIQKLHLRHADRIEPLSLRLTEIRFSQNGGAGIEVETVYYSQRGIMEICRWSRQPKTDAFMDWAWNIMEAYRAGQFNNTVCIDRETVKMLKDLTESLHIISRHQEPAPKYRLDFFPEWTSKMLPKFRLIQDKKFPDSNSLKSVYGMLFTEFNKKYGYRVLKDAQTQFCEEHNCQDCYTMDVVALTPELQQPMEDIVNGILRECY